MNNVSIMNVLDSCEDQLETGKVGSFLTYWLERLPTIKKSLQTAAVDRADRGKSHVTWCRRCVRRINAITKQANAIKR